MISSNLLTRIVLVDHPELPSQYLLLVGFFKTYFFLHFLISCTSLLLRFLVNQTNINLPSGWFEKKPSIQNGGKPISFSTESWEIHLPGFFFLFFNRWKREKRLNSTFSRKIYLSSLANDSCLRQNGVVTAEQSSQSPTKSRPANQITPCNASLLSTANHKISFIQGTNQMLSSKLPIFPKGPSRVSSSAGREKEK